MRFINTTNFRQFASREFRNSFGYLLEALCPFTEEWVDSASSDWLQNSDLEIQLADIGPQNFRLRIRMENTLVLEDGDITSWQRCVHLLGQVLRIQRLIHIFVGSVTIWCALYSSMTCLTQKILIFIGKWHFAKHQYPIWLDASGWLRSHSSLLPHRHIWWDLPLQPSSL